MPDRSDGALRNKHCFQDAAHSFIQDLESLEKVFFHEHRDLPDTLINSNINNIIIIKTL